jgi:hypothetical protein
LKTPSQRPKFYPWIIGILRIQIFRTFSLGKSLGGGRMLRLALQRNWLCWTR